MIKLLLCAIAATCVTLTATAADLPKAPKDTCVPQCQATAAECLACMKHCRENKMEPEAKLCEVCHHVCLACSHAVAARTAKAWEICELCESVCNACAEACEKGSDPHMKKCAEECRKCAVACSNARK